MHSDRRQNILLPGFILVSLLLHLLLIYLLPEAEVFQAKPSKQPAPIEVRLTEPPPRIRPRELDLPPDTPATPRQQPAKRLGPVNRQVVKETAPKGSAAEDQTPQIARRVRPSPPLPPDAPPQVAARPAQAPAAPAEQRPDGERPVGTGTPADRTPDLTRKSLMASAERAAENVAAQQMAELRRKYREEVEQGDAVWLDTEKDLLISFFKRFRDNIYGVWNYPRRAADRGEEGTCLLKITLARDGAVKEVRLMESSGHRDLDEEAIAAVRKGGPYGPISRHYKDETLTIFAFFQYRLGGRYLIGSP